MHHYIIKFIFSIIEYKDKRARKSKSLDGKLICVSGKVIAYQGRPEIVVTDVKQIEQ